MKLLVFDIDGTLTDSVVQHQAVFVEAMKAHGIDRIDSNWSAYLHHTDSYILKVNHENNSDKVFSDALIKEVEKTMTELLQHQGRIEEIKGAVNKIDQLKAYSGIAIAFATGSLAMPALHKLEQAGIWHEPQLLVTANEHQEREEIVKSAIEKAMKHYGQNSFEDVISIGDGFWDWQTAQRLNLNFIGIGAKYRETFKREGVRVCTEHWEGFDVLEALEQLVPCPLTL